jgi:hypothetical protein
MTNSVESAVESAVEVGIRKAAKVVGGKWDTREYTFAEIAARTAVEYFRKHLNELIP